MKTRLSLLLWATLIPLSVFTQEKVFLNGEWDFKIDPYNNGENEAWFNENMVTTNWSTMEVPGNWDLHNEYAEYAGDAWYSRTFEAMEGWQNKMVRLVFESVYNDCKVWVNGIEVGENHLGFLPFEFDISEHLKANEENKITVKVNNIFKRGAIWNWGGIRRPVWLEITDNVRIEYQHITAIPNLNNRTATVKTNVAITNRTHKEVEAGLILKIEKNGKLISIKRKQFVVPANSKEHIIELNFDLPKSKVKLWHHDFPELYKSTVSLKLDTGISQVISDNFGIRKIEVSGTKLLLNGEEIRPVGFNLVPEDRITGNTLPFERIKEDVDMLKELGVTFCRISHLPLPKEYLDYLDEKGIMTFEEVALWGKDKWADPDHPMPKEWLKRMIKEKYNHPSVVGWSVGNEIGYLDNNPKVMDYVKGAIEMTKKLDPNRLAVYVSHSAHNQDIDPVKYSDLTMLNKYNSWGTAAQRAWEKHKKPVFMSEYGNVLNSEDPNLSHINAQEMLEQMRGKEYLIGASLWTFNDYRSFWYGRKGWATPASQNRSWGIVNTFRHKKRSYYEYRKQHAPVKELKVEVIDQSSTKAKITIMPRAVDDIPANVLRGYRLRWGILNKDFDLMPKNSKALKTIFPGDSYFSMKIKWANDEKPRGIVVELIDPQGYSVLNKTTYFDVPFQPRIAHVNTAQNGVRIIFDPVKGGNEYIVRYNRGKQQFESERTINNFVTIANEGIGLNEEWSYEVIALNNAGESQPSNKVTAARDEDELPPVIWEVRPVDDDIVIGYSSSPYDYLYEVEYGNSTGQYHKLLTVKNKGVLRIPNVLSGNPVFLRMRSRKQWGFASEWTHEFTVE